MRWTARLKRFFAGCPLAPRAHRSARLGLEGLEARLTPSTFNVIAGGGTTAPAAATAATAAQLNSPTNVAVDAAGNVYLTDIGHNLVEKVTPAGGFSVIAGGGDTAPALATTATAAQLAGPFGVAVDAAGNVYVSDNGDNLVAKVTPSGGFSVIAGGGTTAPASATVATDAQLNLPVQLGVDALGDVYITDYGNSVIEKVTPAGGFGVVVGGGTTAPASAATPTDAQLNLPYGLAVDANGNLYIADTSDNLVEKATLAVVPAFGGLSSPTAVSGTATVALGGTLAAGATDVAGATVSVTVGGVTETATTDSNGHFAVAFPIDSLTVSGSPYTIAYSYAGGVGFYAAADTSTTLTVTAAPTATVTGTVFRDYNADGVRDGADYGLAGRTLFVDLNGTGTLAAGDPTAVTDAGGNYTLTGVPAGTYTIRVALTTLDQLVGSTATVTTAGGTLAAPDIGLRPNSSVLPVAVSPDLFTNAPLASPSGTFARGLYEAVLGRAPTASELTAAVGGAAPTAAVRQQAAVAFLTSAEYVGDLVAHDYATFLGRAPAASDAAGEAAFAAQLKGGMSPNRVAVELLTSAEFNQQHAGDTDFVQALFRDVLGRTGTAAEVQTYLQLLQGGTSRAAVVGGFVNSLENARDTVTAVFAQYLQRAPDAAGEGVYVAQFLSGTDPTVIAAEVLASAEFATRLGAA
jgi:sugar lactone lactonase YvrE